MIWYAWLSGLATAFATLRFGAGEWMHFTVNALIALYFFWRALSAKPQPEGDA